MSLKEKVRAAVEKGISGDWKGIEDLVSENPQSIRYLVGMTYQADDQLRTAAVNGLALASRSQPAMIQEVARRLVWAMNEESGTNAQTAPEVLAAIARENAEVLLPMVPALTRLAGDPALHEGLAKTLRLIAERFPGEVGEGLSRGLRKRLRRGD